MSILGIKKIENGIFYKMITHNDALVEFWFHLVVW